MPKKSRKKKQNSEFRGDHGQKILEIELTKSKLNIEKATLILNKSMLLYFSFLFVGVIGLMNGYIETDTLNLIIVMGIVALVIGTIPYMFATNKEEKKLNEILEHIKK